MQTEMKQIRQLLGTEPIEDVRGILGDLELAMVSLRQLMDRTDETRVREDGLSVVDDVQVTLGLFLYRAMKVISKGYQLSSRNT